MHGKLRYIPRGEKKQLFGHINQNSLYLFLQFFLCERPFSPLYISAPFYTASQSGYTPSVNMWTIPPQIQERRTYFIPLMCMMLMMMVALMKNNMKKSTISAMSLWRGEGMLYSRPGRRKKHLVKDIITIWNFRAYLLFNTWFGLFKITCTNET